MQTIDEVDEHIAETLEEIRKDTEERAEKYRKQIEEVCCVVLRMSACSSVTSFYRTTRDICSS